MLNREVINNYFYIEKQKFLHYLGKEKVKTEDLATHLHSLPLLKVVNYLRFNFIDLPELGHLIMQNVIQKVLMPSCQKKNLLLQLASLIKNMDVPMPDSKH